MNVWATSNHSQVVCWKERPKESVELREKHTHTLIEGEEKENHDILHCLVFQFLFSLFGWFSLAERQQTQCIWSFLYHCNYHEDGLIRVSHTSVFDLRNSHTNTNTTFDVCKAKEIAKHSKVFVHFIPASLFIRVHMCALFIAKNFASLFVYFKDLYVCLWRFYSKSREGNAAKRGFSFTHKNMRAFQWAEHTLTQTAVWFVNNETGKEVSLESRQFCPFCIIDSSMLCTMRQPSLFASSVLFDSA